MPLGKGAGPVRQMARRLDAVHNMHHIIGVPTLFVIDGVRIMIFADDHNPPHFHARFGEWAMQARIADLAVIGGDLPKAKRRMVLSWAETHQAVLAAHWARLTGGMK